MPIASEYNFRLKSGQSLLETAKLIQCMDDVELAQEACDAQTAYAATRFSGGRRRRDLAGRAGGALDSALQPGIDA